MGKGKLNFKETDEDLRKRLADLKVRQEAGEHMPCPRCGRDAMKTASYIGALSRQADVYVCDQCGQDEALRAMRQTPLSLNEWACFISKHGAGGTNDEL